MGSAGGGAAFGDGFALGGGGFEVNSSTGGGTDDFNHGDGQLTRASPKKLLLSSFKTLRHWGISPC